MNSSEKRTVVTVRELAGELWAEITMALNEEELPVSVKHRLVDLSLGLFARFSGCRLENDDGLPVAPLPERNET